MADSTENNKNLDSYGVWVKRPPQDAKTETSDASDFSDLDSMFADASNNEEPVVADDATFDTMSDNDTTLSDEELNNIASDINLPEKDATIVPDDDMFGDLPDFGEPKTEETTEAIEPAAETASEVPSEETVEEAPADETATDSDGMEEFSIDDFMSDTDSTAVSSTEAAAENTAEVSAETPAEASGTEEVSLDDFGVGGDDGEISLDAFMDGGFTDPNPGASDSPAPSASGSDEISLDDFLDDSSSSGAEKEDDVANDDALDIDLSFAESPEDQVPTEEVSEDSASESSEFDDMFDSVPESTDTAEATTDKEAVPAFDASATEEISLEDFGLDENSDDATAVAAGAAVNASAESEDVDLSDFGIDSSAEETPVKQDVQAAKKKQVVDYDLAITEDDNVAQAPTAETVPDRLAEGVEDVISDESVSEPAANPNSTMVDNSILDQIMAELSGLKSEINNLKGEFEDLKNQETIPVKEETAVSPSDEEAVTEPAVAAAEIPSEPEENTGFFDNNDEDDTIALSGDELNNIMNTADFTETTEEPAATEESEAFTEPAVEETSADNTSIEETPAEETVFEEPAATEETASFEEPVIEDSAVESPVVDETPAETETEENLDIPEENAEIEISETLPDEIASTISIPEEPKDDIFEDTETSSDEENTSAEMVNEEAIPDEIASTDTGLSMGEEKLEEPDFGSESEAESETIPNVDEIASDDSESAADNILVESSNTDLMNSVNDSTEQMATMTADMAEMQTPAPAEDITEAFDDAAEALPDVDEIAETETTAEETAEIPEEDSLSQEKSEQDAFFDSIMTEDVEVKDGISEENIDYLKDEPVADNAETPVIEPVVEQPVAEASEDSSSEPLPDDLKSDVKSVLLYMDQLLENLPEDKIMEFAKSEQFTTYKKLFSELGLS